jgi:hypothetical protein
MDTQAAVDGNRTVQTAGTTMPMEMMGDTETHTEPTVLMCRLVKMNTTPTTEVIVHRLVLTIAIESGCNSIDLFRAPNKPNLR